MEKRSVWYAVQQWRRERQLANEQGHQTPLIDSTPQDEEIVLFEQPAECLDTRAFDEDWFDVHARAAYNTSITQEWQDVDPAEDFKPDTSIPSRIGPSS